MIALGLWLPGIALANVALAVAWRLNAAARVTGSARPLALPLRAR